MYKLNKDDLSERAEDTLDELSEYSQYGEEQDLLEAIATDSVDCDTISEIADGRVSVYTYDRMKWLTDNLGRADQEEAIGTGAKTCEEIAAFCWYRAEEEDMAEDLEEIKDAIEEVEDEEEAE